MILLRLYYEFFKVGLFAVGGGMATIPFLKSMGEAPGKSKFGSAMILFIAACTSIGGSALINGCPGINGMCI